MRVVVALVGGSAGLVPAVLLVLHQEGGALVHQRVDAHLRVDEQLRGGVSTEYDDITR